MEKNTLVWSPNIPAFPTKHWCFWDTTVKVELHACTSSTIKLWEHNAKVFLLSARTFHHITACKETSLCSNAASSGILIYAASCFLPPSFLFPMRGVGGLGFWLHTEPLEPVLGSRCWHISLWAAETMLRNDKWFLAHLLVKPWQITPAFLNWWNKAGRFLSMPDFPDWFMLVSAAL